MKPSFSVVIPLHNKESFVSTALDSVMNQSCPPIEIVVVDDGSSDRGAVVAASHPAGVLVVTQANQGPGAAREAGAKATRGEWIAFLDADDYWFPDHLYELGCLVVSEPAARLVATSHVRRSSHDDAGPAQSPKQPILPKRRVVDYFAAAARDIGVVCSSTAAVRRDALPMTGGFPRQFKGEDLALWAWVALQHPIAVSTRVTAVYLQETGGIMDQSVLSPDLPAEATVNRRELAPSCGIVEDAIESGRHSVEVSSLQKYQNGFLLRRVWQALVYGEPSLAKELARLRRGRTCFTHSVVLRVVQLMPISATVMFFRMFRAATGRQPRQALS